MQNPSYRLRFDAALIPPGFSYAYVSQESNFRVMFIPKLSANGDNVQQVTIDSGQAEICLVNQPYGPILSQLGGSAKLMPAQGYPGGMVLHALRHDDVPTIWIEELAYADLHVRQNTMDYNVAASLKLLYADGLGRFLSIEPWGGNNFLLTLCDERPAIGTNRIALKGVDSVSATISPKIFNSTGLELKARHTVDQIGHERFLLGPAERIKHFRQRLRTSEPRVSISCEPKNG